MQHPHRPDRQTSRLSPENAKHGGASSPSLADAALMRGHRETRRANLLAEAVAQFCEIERPQKYDIEVFKELFYQLVEGCGRSERRSLAASLSRNAYCPRPILFYLAMDDHDIAAPILLFSQALNEHDIITLTKKLSLEHLKIICRRMDLSEEAVRLLGIKGGQECRDILARNPSLTRREEAEAREIRVQDERPMPVQPAGYEKLQSAIKRADHQIRQIEAAARRQTEREPKPLAKKPKKKLTAAFAPDKPVAPGKPAVPDKPAHQINKEMVGLAARGGKLGRHKTPELPPKAPSPAPAFTPQKGEPIERQLVRAARSGGVAAMAKAVERYCQIPSATLLDLSHEGGLEGFAVLFTGLGIGFVSTMQLLLLLDRDAGRSREAYDAAKAMVNRLDRAECRAFLEEIGARFVDAPRAAKSKPHKSDWGAAVASRREAITEGRPSPLLRRTALRKAG